MHVGAHHLRRLADQRDGVLRGPRVAFDQELFRPQRDRILDRRVNESRHSRELDRRHVEQVADLHFVPGHRAADIDQREAVGERLDIAGRQVKHARREDRVDDTAASAFRRRTKAVGPNRSGRADFELLRAADRIGAAEEVEFVGGQHQVAAIGTNASEHSQRVLVARRVFRRRRLSLGQRQFEIAIDRNGIGIRTGVRELILPVLRGGGPPCQSREHNIQQLVEQNQMVRVGLIGQRQIAIVFDVQDRRRLWRGDHRESVGRHFQVVGRSDHLFGLDDRCVGP